MICFSLNLSKFYDQDFERENLTNFFQNGIILKKINLPKDSAPQLVQMMAKNCPNDDQKLVFLYKTHFSGVGGKRKSDIVNNKMSI